MKEEFLHYLWRHRIFKSVDFISVEGDRVEVVSPGIYNTDEGPDFLNARIKINGVLWAGNVEIHVKSSDWLKHNHNANKKYDNIVLHVVYENDLLDKPPLQQAVSTIELFKHCDISLYERYQDLLKNLRWVPCERSLHLIDNSLKEIWIQSLVVERLIKKSEDILQVLAISENNWNETFYFFLFKNFGFKVNAQAFEMLARSFPILILDKHKDSLFQTEALLFGQSGLLADTPENDDYVLSLRKEYNFLRTKFDITPIDKKLWNMLRLRPANFPTVRLAQLAAMIHHAQALFSKITEIDNLNLLKALFSFTCSPYWDNHYNFKSEVSRKSTALGTQAINNIIVNTVVPVLFAYGLHKDDDNYKQRAISFLEQLEPEKNNIISKWRERSLKISNSLDTQALIELKNNFCAHKRCLSCMWGNHILQKH